jgi:hypothetical protein
MKHTLIRTILFVLELPAALGAIAGGLALLTGVIRFPRAQLYGTPFSTCTIPGLILALVVGGSSLIGAATVFLHRELAVLCSAAAGLIFAGWIVGTFEEFYVAIDTRCIAISSRTDLMR